MDHIHMRLTIGLHLASFTSYLPLNNIMTLNSRLGVTQSHWKWHHSTDRIQVPIRLPLWLWPCLVSFSRWSEILAEKC